MRVDTRKDILSDVFSVDSAAIPYIKGMAEATSSFA
jgi:hypothetical protein